MRLVTGSKGVKPVEDGIDVAVPGVFAERFGADIGSEDVAPGRLFGEEADAFDKSGDISGGS